MNPDQVKAAIAEGQRFLESFAPAVRRHAIVGSALYLPDPTDVDFVVELNTDCFAWASDLLNSAQNWTVCGDYDTREGRWLAVRNGFVNLMLTHDPKFFDGYVLAMEVSKALNLQSKAERIAVCRVIRDGCPAYEARIAAGLIPAMILGGFPPPAQGAAR